MSASDGLGPLVVNGVTFEPLRLTVPQIARGLPKELHLFSREMLLAAVAAERERLLSALRKLHDEAGGQHSYYLHAATVLGKETQ